MRKHRSIFSAIFHFLEYLTSAPPVSPQIPNNRYWLRAMSVRITHNCFLIMKLKSLIYRRDMFQQPVCDSTATSSRLERAKNNHFVRLHQQANRSSSSTSSSFVFIKELFRLLFQQALPSYSPKRSSPSTDDSQSFRNSL